MNLNQLNSKSVDLYKAASFADKRNRFTSSFFKNALPNHEIRLVSTEKQTTIIVDYEIMLSCYANNTEIVFCDEKTKGKKLFSVGIEDKDYIFNETQFNDWFEKAKHKKVYRVFLETKEPPQPPLFLSGWQFKDKDNKEGKYPVFSEHEPKFYFTEQRAKQIAEELAKENFTVITI